MSEKEINEIKSQIGDLKAKLVSARDRLRDAQMRHAGISIGDVILVKMGRGTVKAKVTGWIGWDMYGRPEAVVIKKDGTAGKASAPCWRGWSKSDEENM